MKSLKEDQCGVCGDYCFGTVPYPWEKRETPSGQIQVCGICSKRYPAGGPINDPARDYRIRRITARLNEAESLAESLRETLETI